MIAWLIAIGSVVGLFGLIIAYVRSDAVKGKEKLDLEAALKRDRRTWKKSGATDAEVARSRNALRRWLRFQKLPPANPPDKPLP